jgi:protein kinase-like protein
MLGGYELIEQIGRGAVGAVFKARQVSVDRIVALKVLTPRLAKKQDFVERFLREARAAAQFSHVNIVQAIDAGKAGPYYYFAMEFVDGESAGQALSGSGRLSQPRALEIVRDIGHGLAQAHRSGFIHRDVKPDNILIGPGGVAKLVDLGLARETVTSDSQLTQSGMAIGTPDYISPEQVRGQADLDGRTDVYSLGATLYHLVTGRPAFSGNSTVETMTKHLTEPVPDPRRIVPQLSRGVVTVIRRAMAKHRDQRYATVEQMLEQVETLLATGEEDVSAAAESTTHHDAAPTAKPRRVLWIAAAAGVAIAIAAGVWALSSEEEQKPKPVTDAVPITLGAPPAESKSWTAVRSLEFIDAWVAEHPGQYSEPIRNYNLALVHLADKGLRDRVEAAIESLKLARKSEADGVFQGLNDEATKLAAEQRYDDAVAVFASMPAELAELLTDRAEQAKVAIRSLADAEIGAVLNRARTLGRSGRQADALKELDKLASVQYAARAAEAPALRQQLERALKKWEEAERERRRLAAIKRAAEQALAAIDAATLKGDLGAAATHIAAARKNADVAKSIETKLRAFQKVCAALQAEHRCRTASPIPMLKRLIGKDVSLETRQGVRSGLLTGVTEDEAVIDKPFKIDGIIRTRTYRVKVEDLLPKTLAELRPTWTPRGADEHIAAAVLAVRNKDATRLKAALAAAGRHVLATRYRGRLSGASPSGSEAAARAAWKRIQEIAAIPLTAQTAKKLGPLLDALDAEHGSTKAVSAQAGAIAALRKKIVALTDDPFKIGKWVSFTSGRAMKRWHMPPGTKMAKDVIVLPSVSAWPAPQLEWQGPFPRSNYELEVEAMPVDSTDYFCSLVVPVGKRSVTITTIDRRLRLMEVDDRMVTVNTRLALARKKWHRFRVRVTPAFFTVWVNGTKIVERLCDGSVFRSPRGAKPLAIYASGTQTGIRSVRMRRIAGEDPGELAARTEWKRIVKVAGGKLNASSAGRLRLSIDALEKEHGGTKYIKLQARAISTLRDKIALLADSVVAAKSYPPGKWVSLTSARGMKLWRLAKGVKVSNGKIVLPRSDDPRPMQWKGPLLQDGYTIDIEAMPLDSTSRFCNLVMPVGKQWVELHLSRSSISAVRSDSSSYYFRCALPIQQKQWCALRVQVTPAALYISVNGQSIMSMRHKTRTFRTRQAHRFAIWASGTRTGVRAVRLRRADPVGGADAIGKQFPVGQWVNMTAKPVLKSWRMPDGTKMQNNSIVLPDSPKREVLRWAGALARDNYELEIEAMSLGNGIDLAAVVVPVGDGEVTVDIRSDELYVSYIGRRNYFGSRFTKVEAQQWFKFRVRVTPASFTVWVNGKKGYARARAGGEFTSVHGLRPLAIYSANGRLAVRSVRMRRLAK